MAMPDTQLGNYGADEAAMQEYLRLGTERAFALGNRGPVRYGPDRHLAQDILDAYWRTGFYVFEGVLKPEELADLEADIEDIKSRLPVSRESAVDSQGRQALGVGLEAPTLFWSKPLGDPFGGTELANGRHPVKMIEPKAAADAPKEVVYLLLGTLQFSEASLRLYGHPDILAIAAGINGDEFTPFTEGIFLKEPGRGASVAWHQDGVTHWNSPDWHQGSHGFNSMTQLYGCTAANGVWVVPGSHKLGKVDIRAMVQAAGSERLPDAVPLICAPGDVAVTNRQAVHGSFANTSKDWRVTFNAGFHPLASVLNVEAGGIHNARAVYDEARIRDRARLIGYGIAARQQRFPDEKPYAYAPHVKAGLTYRWDDAAKSSLRDYNLQDLSI